MQKEVVDADLHSVSNMTSKLATMYNDDQQSKMSKLPNKRREISVDTQIKNNRLKKHKGQIA